MALIPQWSYLIGIIDIASVSSLKFEIKVFPEFSSISYTVFFVINPQNNTLTMGLLFPKILPGSWSDARSHLLIPS